MTSIVLMAAVAGSAVMVQASPLRTRIEALAIERGFQVDGLELIGEERILSTDRFNSSDQIGRLLANYNFVIARDADGRITRLTIVSLRQTSSRETSSIATDPVELPHGTAEHYVNAILAGPNGRSMKLRVLVDTGASTLVLPSSLMMPLGFSDGDLLDVRVQTANGTANGAMATLQSVRVGDAQTKDVAVTFVEDRLLGGKQLLGMSFLGRFRMTIDGHGGPLRLEKRAR